MNKLNWIKKKPKIEDIGKNILLVYDPFFKEYKCFEIESIEGELYLCELTGEIWEDYEDFCPSEDSKYAIIKKL